MGDKTLSIRLTNRSDTAMNWSDENPVLLLGEIGYESDTNRFKIGNGVTVWKLLSYASIGSFDTELIGDGVTSSFTIKHNRNKLSPVVSVVDKVLNRQVWPEIINISYNELVISFLNPISAGRNYEVSII